MRRPEELQIDENRAVLFVAGAAGVGIF